MSSHLETKAKIQVETAARLHLGFLDLGGSLGRTFGSIGLALNDISTVVTVGAHEQFAVEGMDAARAERYALAIIDTFDLPSDIKVTVEESILPHAGLGSGTQLALAVGRAITEFHNRRQGVEQIAQATGRGRRSGIGIGLFETGGLVVDAGRGPLTSVPPVIAHQPFPKSWSAILIFDHDICGLSGNEEQCAFDELTRMPSTIAADLCHLTVMKLLPALTENDFVAFSEVVSSLQEVMADYFSSSQGGRFTSPRVASVIEHARTLGFTEGLGQSSWGPTGFIFVENDVEANHLMQRLLTRLENQKELSLRICHGRNHAAVISTIEQSVKQPPVVA